MKAEHRSLTAFIIAFFIVFYLAWLVPMQSDDFSYHNMGLTWESHVAHYMGWSGRFVADYISAFILSMNSQWFTAASKAFAIVGAITMISRMPAIWLGIQPKTELFVFIIALYWGGNLVLGQTALWTVGAANYLFPVFFAILYLFLFSLYCNRPTQKWRYFFPLLLTGLLAGCSNENTGWVMVFATVVGAIYLHKQRKDKAVWILLIPVLIGFSILLLSPGNAVRAAHPGFAEVFKTSFFDRFLHFTFAGGFPKALAKLLPFWGIAVILMIIGRRAIWSATCRWATLGLIACAIASAYSLVVSPAVPNRTLSGPIFIALIAVAFAYTPLISGPANSFLRWRSVFIAGSLLFALITYVAMIFSYQRVAQQEKVRMALIQQAVNSQQKNAIVPEFFYPRSLRPDDGPDSYHNEIAMGKYYGLKGFSVVPLNYDYSIILDGDQYPVQAGTAIGANVFDKLYLGRSNIRGGTTVIFTGSIPEVPLTDAAQLRVVATLQDGRQESWILPWSPFSLPERQIAGLHVPMSKKDIVGVEYAVIHADGTDSKTKGLFTMH